MKCNLFILNRNLELLGSIDDSESVIVSKRYNGIDDIQISISKTKENTDLLAYGNYVVVNNRIDTIFRIYKRTEMLSAGGEQINVLGYSVEKLLSQRVTMPPVDNTNLEVENTISNVAYTYINESCIENIQRKELNFTKIGLGATVENDLIIKDSTRYKPLYDEIQRLCNLNSYGTKSYLDMVQSKILVEVYRGEDKTFGNTEGNVPIVFSRDYENIINTSLDYDYTVVQNDIIAGGQGEGANRVIAYVNNYNMQTINLIENSNFANTDNWQQAETSAFNIANNTAIFTANAQWGRIGTPLFNTPIGHKLYYCAKVKTTAANIVVGLGSEAICTYRYSGVAAATDNTFTNVSGVVDAPVAKSSFGVADDKTSGWTSTQVRDCMVIDLTQTYGAGNEPTKEWCDINLPYFNGVRNDTIGQPPQAEDIVTIFQDARNTAEVKEIIVQAESSLVQPQVSIDGAINPFVAYEYLKDYQLGDKVTLFINGNRFDERIVECVETYENNNFKLQVIFGQKVYNITDVIKQQTKSIKQLEVI